MYKVAPGSSFSDSLKIQAEIVANDNEAIERLDSEIIVARAILQESMNELHELTQSSEQKQIGRREWIRRNIIDTAEKISIMIERHHKIKYGEFHTIRVEEVKNILLVVQEIILRNVPDPDILTKITNDIEKTIVLKNSGKRSKK